MALQTIKDISARAFNATADATETAFDATCYATVTAARVTFNAVGAGVTYTLDGIEYVDEKIDAADLAMENAAGAAGRKTAGIFGEHAEPHGERAGKIVYKGIKIAINFIQLPGMWQEGVEILKTMRRG